MNILFDTNVWIAAFISRGACADLFAYCARSHTLITSNYILKEFRINLISKFSFSHVETAQAVHLIRARSQRVIPAKLSVRVCSDPKDVPILGSALAGKCQCLVTGDKILLDMKQYQDIDIVKPNDFWRYEETRVK